MSLRSKQEYYNSERDNEVLMFLKFSLVKIYKRRGVDKHSVKNFASIHTMGFK